MKIIQTLGCFCHWDATLVHTSLELTEGLYAPDIVFVEAPDYVCEGWGFDETAEGDERFIEPTPPEGWLYDRETGTFYPDPDYVPSTPAPDPEEMEQALTLGVQTLETDS